MKKFLIFCLIITASIIYSDSAKAAIIEVNSIEQLQNEVGNATEDVEVKLGDEFPTTKDFILNINHVNKFTIDGHKEKLKFKSRMDIKFLKHSAEQQFSESVLKNFHFNGENKRNVGIRVYSDISEKDFSIRILKIQNSVLENSTESVIQIEKPRNLENYLTLFISNSKIRNNISQIGGAVLGKNNVSISLEHSVLENNNNQSNQIGGGAITLNGNDSETSISSSRFINNQISGSAINGNEIGGGAIYLGSTKYGTLNIYDSHFDRNHTKSSGGQSGGAIFIENLEPTLNTYMNMYVSTSNFSNNSSSGDGGAIAMTAGPFVRIQQLFNASLFYKNNSKKAGSALSLKSSEKVTLVDSPIFNRLTFYGNSSSEKHGGAINFTNIESDFSFTQSIFAKNNGGDIYSNLGKLISIDSLGVEHEVNSEELFGKYDIPLKSNRGGNQIGTKEDNYIMPSISVIPKFTDNKNEIIIGKADPANEFIPQDPIGLNQSDLRGNWSRNLTLGSVYNASILYDANEGNFNLPQLTEYTGEEYYEGTKPSQYGELWLPREKAIVADGKVDLNIKREGYTFNGWSKDRTGKPTNGMQPKDEFSIQGQIKLFAVWKINKYETKYFGNGHTSGTAPKMIQKNYDSTMKINDKGSLKRKGYTFVGWSEKPTSAKANPKFKPGINIRVTSKNNLYAVWKRN